LAQLEERIDSVVAKGTATVSILNDLRHDSLLLFRKILIAAIVIFVGTVVVAYPITVSGMWVANMFAVAPKTSWLMAVLLLPVTAIVGGLLLHNFVILARCVCDFYCLRRMLKREQARLANTQSMQYALPDLAAVNTGLMLELGYMNKKVGVVSLVYNDRSCIHLSDNADRF
jgi:hypothetical protein